MSTDAKTSPNADLCKQLKQMLAMAEAGTITDAVLVGIGPKVFHRTFSVPKPEDMPAMIGELGMFRTEMELIVMGNRTEQMQARASGIIGGNKLSS